MPRHEIETTPRERGELGKYLWDTRNALGWTLRQAEEESGVSNAYINQIENGTIKKPSPGILHKLATAYKAPYQHLMELAGHIKKSDATSTRRRGVVPTSTLADVHLTKDEEEEVRQFISFLKMRNRKAHEK